MLLRQFRSLADQGIYFTSGVVKGSARTLFLNEGEIDFFGNESLEAFMVRARWRA